MIKVMRVEKENKIQFVEALRARTKKFTVDVIKFTLVLPKTDEARHIKRQLLRSASSVGANYRAVCRARSKAEFFAKMSITVEEADESLFWFEILEETNIVQSARLKDLKKEITEILSILSKARRNT